jgi:hypothetical protein
LCLTAWLAELLPGLNALLAENSVGLKVLKDSVNLVATGGEMKLMSLYRMIFDTVAEPKPVLTTRRNMLIVYFKNGMNRKAWMDDWDSPKLVTPWIPFYKWFFTGDKEYFMLNHDEGMVLIRRENIDHFEILVKKVTIP